MPATTTLTGMRVGVAPGEGDQVVLIIEDTMLGNQYHVPLDPAGAQMIGKALTVPRVAQPPQNALVLPR